MAKQLKKIYLASASPRRRELLEKMGLKFDIVPANIDEQVINEKSPKALVKALSREKARAIDVDGVVIGADTVVAVGRKIYGKPYTFENACDMLCSLSGKTHSVFTGVTVREGGREKCFCVCSRVTFKELDATQIHEYVSRFSPLDKAGAYGIQDDFVVLKYSGSYDNIVGLPTEKLAKVLAKFGVTDDKY